MRTISFMTRNSDCRSRFRNVLTLSVLLALPPSVPAQKANRFCPSLFALPVAHAGTDPELGPQPPCGSEPIPPYPGPNDPPNVKAWSKSALGRDWKPPACAGWSEAGFTTLITIVARFRYNSGSEGLLRHMGAISGLVGTRYWSTTHKQWRTFIIDAHALTDSQRGQRREDFTANEMKGGKDLYFEQTDNLAGKAVYRMHIAEASANRLVFEIENATTMRHLMVPVLRAGEMQSVYFLDRESDDVWRYYSIMRTARNANGLIAANESSSVNRAVAFYRHIIGIPTDQEPPAAR
jgi:hypothetical protein